MTTPTPAEAFEAFLMPPRTPETSGEAKLAEAAERSRIAHDAEEVEVYAWGSGAPVLLVHGWGGRGTVMGAYVQPLLAAGHRIVTFDAPAHGRSAGAQCDGLRIAGAIEAVAAREGAFHAIIAHSVGATGAARALSQGVRAERVAFLAPCCWVANVAARFARDAGLDDSGVDEVLRIFHERYGHVVTSIEAMAPALATPLLILHDPADREIPYADGEAIARAWPGAKVEEVRNVGHRRILRAREVVARVMEWVEG